MLWDSWAIKGVKQYDTKRPKIPFIHLHFKHCFRCCCCDLLSRICQVIQYRRNRKGDPYCQRQMKGKWTNKNIEWHCHLPCSATQYFVHLSEQKHRLDCMVVPSRAVTRDHWPGDPVPRPDQSFHALIAGYVCKQVLGKYLCYPCR